MRYSIQGMPLLWQIWSVHFLITAFVVMAVGSAIDHYGADYLMKIMKQYNVSPIPLHAMFTDELQRLTRIVGAMGALLGAVLGFFVSRGIVKPLNEIVLMTGRISSGDRSVRIRAGGQRDISQLADAFNHLVTRLRQKEEMQVSLITNVAHELRTPLANIRGYLEALTDEVLPPSKDLFRSLHEETLLLTKVVESLFALAEAGEAANNLRLADRDLPAIIERAIGLSKPRIDARRIEIETCFEPGAERVLADADRIVQVVRNLLQNASEHTPSGGRIQVLARSLPDAIELSVTDNGEGIDEADLPFIFDRFFRGRRRLPGDARGAGLGLAIVKELVEAHGGRVGVDAMTKGARIWFTLPKGRETASSGAMDSESKG